MLGHNGERTQVYSGLYLETQSPSQGVNLTETLRWYS